MNVNKSKRTGTATPPKPRGRPPLPPGEGKRTPLTIRSTQALKEELVKAAKASGRSLAQEIELRLVRSLIEDHGKSEQEMRIDRFWQMFKTTVLTLSGQKLGLVDTGSHLVIDKELLPEHGFSVEMMRQKREAEAKAKPKPKSRRPKG